MTQSIPDADRIAREKLQAQLAYITTLGIGYRDSKGFAPCTWETLPIRLMSLTVEVGELAEAIEEQRANRRYEMLFASRAIRDEFADCALYALGMLHDLGVERPSVRTRYHGARRLSSPAAELVQPLRMHCEQAHRAWAMGDERDVTIALELFVAALLDLRTRMASGPLASDVQRKVEAMQARPATHGKDIRC